MHSRKVCAAVAATLLIATATVVAGHPGPARATDVADRDPMILAVDVSKPVKDVDHAASGALYGLGDEGWPTDKWVAAIKPKMFTQPPPGATHQPNGEPEPVGDTLKVWRAAKRNGAMVTIRLPDIFPTFPYQWQGEDFWFTQVERMVRAKLASGADNIYGYEIWNEPQWTWNPASGDFNEIWARTYRLIRSLDPDTPIIGPSHDRDFANGMRSFLRAAVASNTVPDIISWHELNPATGLDVEEHVKLYREIEREFGVGPLPISINEYAAPRDAGVPGWLARFVARLERSKVDTANLAFWHKPGRLADLLVPVGGGSGPARAAEPTGNFWLFKWYGDMTGSMVETMPPSRVGRTIPVGTPTPAPALDGFAGADRRTKTVRVVFGGGRGDIRLKVGGLRALRGFDGRANVQVFTAEWTGTDGTSRGPVALFEGDYPVHDGSISVPVSGIKDSDAYLAVVRPARDAPAGTGPVRRHEAEAAVTGANRPWLSIATDPLASENRYVRPKRARGGELGFTVNAPVAGTYDLDIRYANRSGSAARDPVVVNGAATSISYQPTATAAPFSTHRAHVVLRKGGNTIKLGLGSGAVSVDYIDVTPFRTRIEAEHGEWVDANLVTVDMDENNFFANYVSKDAYVGDFSQPTSALRLPVTVPAAGTYRLTIGYSTAGTEAERRAQTTAGQFLRVNEGQWHDVVYPPTQFRELIRQTTVVVELPAGTSTITLAKERPDNPGQTKPGTVDLDYLDIELQR